MADQDPRVSLEGREVQLTIYPEGQRVTCSIAFQTLQAQFGVDGAEAMREAVISQMHLVEAAALRAWRSTPIGEPVVIKPSDF